VNVKKNEIANPAEPVNDQDELIFADNLSHVLFCSPTAKLKILMSQADVGIRRHRKRAAEGQW